MEIMKIRLGKLLYGTLFTVALPILLVVWAIKTHDLVDLPVVHSLPWGIGAVGLGALLMALGVASLWFVGGGLPMNAFPPPRYVSGGVYGLFSHPIYLGFSLACDRRRFRQRLVAGVHHRNSGECLASAGIRTAGLASALRPWATSFTRRCAVCAIPDGAHSLLSDRAVAMVLYL